MYNSLQSRSKLSGWKSSGDDPCGDSWKGITYSGSSVTQMDLSDLGLSGSMGYQLESLTSVTKFDLSKNNLNGDIPYQLPPNAKYIDLSQNGFSNTVPYSVSQMSHLEILNLGRNKLNGQLSDMFGKLTKLKELDLSYNSLTGNLPQSFGKLSSLKKLYLQNNQLTGQINVLIYTPIEELNIENNGFSGWIPNDLKGINIKSGGNSWSSGPSPPSPPGAHRNRGSGKKSGTSNSSVVTGVTIAGIALALLLLLAIIIALFSRKKRSSTSHLLDDDRLSQRKSFRIYSSKDLSKELTSDYKDSAVSFDTKPVSKSPSIGFKSLSGRLQSFARRSTSVKATAYALEDLQVATANFAPARLHGQGTIGRVYRAKYSDGKMQLRPFCPFSTAPECTKPSAFTGKSDVYSFGVVMLELLTGRMPVDSSKPPAEQCLVRWITPQLRDLDALAQIVDLALRGLYPPKSVSRFAGIVALCVQREPEFRPPMSEVVQQLVWLVQSSDANMREAFGLGASRHSSAMSSRREDLAASRRLTYF
ncbi:hypothetical protein C1H46_001891 [Malus baccata]|uniref:Protein kinase domain-containing protein n=1 Tax=Malus baccata TaxID=106549 RepID=A0A540NPQ4_MALBA|nr:hypothetical protein C1H46_001891 [Malus baccata]